MQNSVNKHHKDHIHNHTNVFVDLNGIPYLLAEYLDRTEFQQVDRSQIKSEIVIDQSDAMRAIIDISIDDIGKRTSDGLPATVGNTTKQKKLMKMIDYYKDQMNHQLCVLRRGIVMRVNYQLENSRTRQVIRSMCEDLRITDRNYFLDINPNDINDNGIIVNFSNSLVSTVNEFTHGMDRMVLRITNIQMMYEYVKTSPKMPRVKQSLSGNANNILPSEHCDDMNYYRYHDQMQNRHVIGNPGGCGCDTYSLDVNGLVSPPSLASFNRFYQFSEDQKCIILHGQEIYDQYCQTALIPCGTVVVNRAFIINPGHRLIFKFSVWKNDCTVVNDTSKIAQILQVPTFVNHGCECNHHHHDHHDECKPDYDIIMREIRSIIRSDRQQNQMINQLMGLITNLQTLISNLHNQGIPPIDPIEPDDDNKCSCGCNVVHDEMNTKIEQITNDIVNISNDITNIETDIDTIENESGTELTPDELADMWENGTIPEEDSEEDNETI